MSSRSQSNSDPPDCINDVDGNSRPCKRDNCCLLNNNKPQGILRKRVKLPGTRQELSTISLCDKSGTCIKSSKQGSTFNIIRYPRQPSSDDEGVGQDNYKREKLTRMIEKWPERFNYIIHPFSNLRLSIHIITMFVLHFNSVFIPFDIAFSHDKPANSNLVIKLVTDFWLFIFIFANFKTGFVDMENYREDIEFDPIRIADRYMKFGFWVDFIAAFPLDVLIIFLIEVFSPFECPRELKCIRLLKLLSIVGVTRDSNRIQVSRRIEYLLNVTEDKVWEWKRLYHPIFLIWLVTHVCACIQFGVPHFKEFPEKSWVVKIGIDHERVSSYEQYMWSIVKSQSEMLGLGFEVVVPETISDIWSTQCSQTIGGFAFGFFTGNMIAVVDYRNTRLKGNRMRVSELREYMTFKKFPTALRKRIQKFYVARFKMKYFSEQQTLNEVSDTLRKRIVWHNTAKYLLAIPFFVDVSRDFITALGQRMKFTVYLKGDEIAKQGEYAIFACFLCTGELDVDSTKKKRRTRLRAGMYFGETTLFTNQIYRRTAKITATDVVSVYKLMRGDYIEVAREFPEDGKKAQWEFDSMRKTLRAQGKDI